MTGDRQSIAAIVAAAALGVVVVVGLAELFARRTGRRTSRPAGPARSGRLRLGELPVGRLTRADGLKTAGAGVMGDGPRAG